MGFLNGQIVDEDDFINQAEKDATPANDLGKAVKLEGDGKFAAFFTKNGQVLNAGGTLNGATLPVPVYQNKTDNELYACDGNDTGKLKFAGFVTSDSTDGNPISFQGSGIVGGFSSLDEGEKYYLQDAVGTIGTTPGTYEVLVGVAISATELLIMKGNRRAAGGLTLGTTVSNQAITTGFRPSIIRIYGLWSDSDSSCHLRLAYVNGTLTAINAYMDPGTGGVAGTDARLYSQNVANYVTVGISSVTDTGFTITLAETGTFQGNGQLLWEAEGEL